MLKFLLIEIHTVYSGSIKKQFISHCHYDSPLEPESAIVMINALKSQNLKFIHGFYFISALFYDHLHNVQKCLSKEFF